MENQNFTDYLDFTKIDSMTSQVTQEDINNGIQHEHEACALALAITRMFPGYRVFVDDYVEISHNKGETFIRMLLSDKLLIWINTFDNKTKINSTPVKPIKITIKKTTLNQTDGTGKYKLYKNDNSSIQPLNRRLGMGKSYQHQIFFVTPIPKFSSKLQHRNNLLARRKNAFLYV